MRTQANPSSETLAGALRAYGVNFLLGGDATMPEMSPGRLITGLAESREARLRLALIPLFLNRPDLAASLKAVLESLSDAAGLTLRCYYTAAVLIQQIYREDMVADKGFLPELFREELALPPHDHPEARLVALAQRHGELSGENVNWLGTYHHAARTWQMGLRLAEPTV